MLVLMIGLVQAKDVSIKEDTYKNIIDDYADFSAKLTDVESLTLIGNARYKYSKSNDIVIYTKIRSESYCPIINEIRYCSIPVEIINKGSAKSKLNDYEVRVFGLEKYNPVFKYSTDYNTVYDIIDNSTFNCTRMCNDESTGWEQKNCDKPVYIEMDYNDPNIYNCTALTEHKIKVARKEYTNYQVAKEYINLSTPTSLLIEFEKPVTEKASYNIIIDGKVDLALINTRIVLDPTIEISDCDDLQDMADDLTADYVLTADIDCDVSPYNETTGFLPIGNATNIFNGTFDGQNYTITGLFQDNDTKDYMGLFGYIENSTITEVGMINVSIVGHDYVGSLVGFFKNSNLSDSYSTGEVNSTRNYVGGLVGIVSGFEGYALIERSYADVDVNASSAYQSQKVGGLVGENSYAEINNSYAKGNVVSGRYYTGGLVGRNRYSNISNSYAIGNVTATYRNLGGFVGELSGDFAIINNSFSVGNVTTLPEYSSSFIGRNRLVDDNIINNVYWNNKSGNLDYCYISGSYPYTYGNENCTAILDNETYFYNVNNSPMDTWDFTNVWSDVNNGTDFPILQMQIPPPPIPPSTGIKIFPDEFVYGIHTNLHVTVYNESPGSIVNMGEHIWISIQQPGDFPEEYTNVCNGSLLSILFDILMDFPEDLVPSCVPYGSSNTYYINWTNGSDVGNSYQITYAGQDYSWSGAFDYFQVDGFQTASPGDTFDVLYLNTSVVQNITTTIGNRNQTTYTFPVGLFGDYAEGIWTVGTNATGDGTAEYRNFSMGRYTLYNSTGTANIGLNYYETFNIYIEKEGNVSLKSYQPKFLIDDFGSLASIPFIEDIDNDSAPELGIPDYSGKFTIFNWSGIKQGLRESIDDTDRGTYYLTTAQGDRIFGQDNNGNGIVEIAVNDYNGYTRVLEYNGSSWIQLFATPDVGYYRNSPLWCDIDMDGDDDLFACSYEGVCRLWTYEDGAYTLNFTDSDRGTFHYSTHPVCGDIRNNGRNYIIVNVYDGKLTTYNWTGTTLSMVWQDSDRGSYYTPPKIGRYLSNEYNNYIMTADTSGYYRFYNCTEGGGSFCTHIDESYDTGSLYYGAGEMQNYSINNKDYVFNCDTGAEPQLAYMSNPSFVTASIMDNRIYGENYIRIGIASTGGIKTPDYLLYNNRYDGDIRISYRNNQAVWDSFNYYTGFYRRYYDNEYKYGYLYGTGWVCDNFDWNDTLGDFETPADECFVSTYDGFGSIWMYENISEFRLTDENPVGIGIDFFNDPELNLLDIMPRDAVMYFPKGSNRTYCVNEKRNLFTDGVDDGWINIIDDDGSILNAGEITDNILSTDVQFHYQNSYDYTTFDSGADQGFRLNVSRPVEMGSLKYWTRYEEEYNPYEFSIEISNTSCTHPDTNIYKTVFDYRNQEDIIGNQAYQGLTVRFLPQTVGCIRINASGAYYGGASYTPNNYVTELSGYYGNNCTFYIQPTDVSNALIHNSYEVDVKAIKPFAFKDSPNQQDSNMVGDKFGLNYIWNLTVLDRRITWITKE